MNKLFAHKSLALFCSTLLAAAGMTSQASAATLNVFSNAGNIVAPSGTQNDLSANVVFSVSGSTMTITLTDTQPSATTNGNELIGIFFNVTGGMTATLTNAQLGAGATILPSGGDVGAFAFTTTGNTSNSGPTGLSSYGISAAGLGISYQNIILLGGGASSPSGLDGADGGLVGTGGAGANVSKPVIKSSLVYTLSNVSGITSSGDLINNITGVQFFYGTTLGETPGQSVPLPAAAWSGMTLLGAVGAAAIRRRRRA